MINVERLVFANYLYRSTLWQLTNVDI